ncbi:MAG: hypothetical protein ABI423_00525 [Burkholderiales bacterium]
MPTTTLFIGSSAAAKSQARVIVAKFQGSTLKFVPGWGAFTAGRTLLEDLDQIRGKVDGAVLLFAPDARSTVRRKFGRWLAAL